MIIPFDNFQTQNNYEKWLLRVLFFVFSSGPQTVHSFGADLKFFWVVGLSG